jgi:hypothetical protein
MNIPKDWIIQRCTQKSVWHPELPGAACWELLYEDWPTPEGRMTRDEMLVALERVAREYPDDEFRGHRLFTPAALKLAAA